MVELHEDAAHDHGVLVGARVQGPDVVVVRLVEQQVDRHPVLDLWAARAWSGRVQTGYIVRHVPLFLNGRCPVA